jgi:predicted Holliday junction resolvase-like endonuclease
MSLEIFTILSFSCLMLALKFYYDKYLAEKDLIQNLLKEIDNLTASDATNIKKLYILESSNLNLITKTTALKENLESLTSSHESKLNSLKKTYELDLNVKVKAARADALNRSRSVLRGQATEHLAPYILKDTNPKDYRFMGNPVDYICFEGLSDLLDGISNEITSIHFIDVKTGKASLNKSQRRIRDAIKESRVQFSVINLDKELEKQNDQINTESKPASATN